MINKQKIKNMPLKPSNNLENKENYNTYSNKNDILEKEMTKEKLNKENIINKENMPKNEISLLRKSYTEMKNDRVKTEKDIDLLEHKLKILQGEEFKVLKKFEAEKKLKEDDEQTKQKALEQKKLLSELKSKKKKNTTEMSKKIKDMKNYSQSSLNVKKMMRFQENRLSNLQLKQQKLENDEKIRFMMKEENMFKKRMAESVKLREKTYLDKKKTDEEERRIKLKKELEVKLMEEQFRKKMYESRLSTLEEIESGLIKKIKLSESFSKSDRKYRSASTGPQRKI